MKRKKAPVRIADRREDSVATLLVFATEMTQVGGNCDADLEPCSPMWPSKIDIEPIIQSHRSGTIRLCQPLGRSRRLPCDQRHDHQQHDGEADVVVKMYDWFEHFLCPGSARPLSELVL